MLPLARVRLRHWPFFFVLPALLGGSLRAALPALPGAVPVAVAPSAPAGKEEITTVAVAARRVGLQKEIATTRSELGKLPEGKFDETALWLTQETALLERIDHRYTEQQRTLQHAADLAKEAADVAERTQSRRPPEATLKPPFGLKLLDQLYTERDYIEQARGWLKTDVANATDALGEARARLDEKDRARRTAREALGKAKDHAKAQSDLRLAELESRLARETLLLREQAVTTLKLQQSLLEPKRALLLPNLDWLRTHLVAAGGEVAAEHARQEKRAAEIDAAIDDAKDAMAKDARLVVAAERRAGTETMSDELESRRADRQTASLTLDVLGAQRARLGEAAAIDDLRLRVLTGGGAPGDLRAWAATNQEALDRLEKIRMVQRTELVQSRKELQDLQGRLARGPGADGKKAPWVGDRVQRLLAWVALSDRELAEVDGIRTERNRLKEELGDRVRLFSWRDTGVALRENLVAAWDYEVFSVKDQPIRVKTILTVLLLIGLGRWLSRRSSRLVGRLIFQRLGMNRGRRAAWEALLFYGLFLIVVLVAFNLFHVSLTQFSVVSGALAVGIGFGSQNLIGNFISGIILLIERPINQGDVIEIDGQRVTVQSLGPRSTIVRSFDNTHVIVPNSRLLEQPVINWTLSDEVVRRRIGVGVAYGSSTRDVVRVLTEAMAGLESVLKEPAPAVRFADFGDNALIFEALFWCDLGEIIDGETELRHRIAEALAKAGIVMAFPQRDVHLDTAKPLRIEVTQAKPRADRE